MTIKLILVGAFGFAYLPILLFLAIVGIWNGNMVQALVFLAAVALFCLLCFRVAKGKRIPKKIAGVVAATLGVLWAIQTARRSIFVLTEGGMENSDGQGSPLAFVLGIAAEFFLLGLPAVGLLLIALFHRNESATSEIQASVEDRRGA